jgi:hypothetical protein
MSDMIWAQLVHIGYKMWADKDSTTWPLEYVTDTGELQFNRATWDELLPILASNGVNTVVMDLGEGVRYDSHPEIALDGAWTPGELKAELAKMRAMGLTPIPKMNFSATHDEWLGPYSRMLSTDTYYGVVADLIAEVCTLFDTPPLFHLGMDEETWGHQTRFSYVVVRQHDLWWKDFLFYVEQVEKAGVRAWIWSDFIWHHKDEFLACMPKSVLQSNWYYGGEFGPEIDYVAAYHQLEEAGYDQVPTGSNWSDPNNFEKTVRYCGDVIAPERLKGFMQSVWKPTVDRRRERHIEASRELGFGRKAWETTQ